MARRTAGNAAVTNSPTQPIFEMDDVIVWKEPDWTQTTVDLEDLKAWLTGRGVYPEFFFPTVHADGFRDKSDVRYSAKLACAVADWETVCTAAANKTVKETVSQWVSSNGGKFGMADSDGVVPAKAVEEVAKVVNWATKGGATPTHHGEAEREPTPVQNFRPFDDPDSEIPF